MLTRRSALLGAAAMGAVALSITQSCSSGSSHEEVARSLRRPIIVNNSDRTALLRELVQYATLAPSSHNTQCW